MSPGRSLKGMMLKLKLQYFGHLMRRVDSLEKTLMLGGQEEKGMTKDEMAGWHHWLDGRESEWTPGVGDGQESWCAVIHGVAKSRTQLNDWTELNWIRKKYKKKGNVRAAFLYLPGGLIIKKVLEFQLEHHSFQRNPRADLLQNGLVGSPCSPRDSQESSPTPQVKSINSSALSLLHSPTLTSIHDHRKNHSLD